MLLHDVLWPYGRRDLYYDPETVPAEFRQPYKQAGMRMDRKKLLPKGGLNPTMFNAEVEGGPRNGVMTAIDDWMAEHDRPLRLLVLPIYFGLAIVVEEERLQQQPEIAAALERLESREGKHDLLELGEDLRLRAMVMQHNMHYPKLATIERLTARYLDTIKAALLNEHYLETETRLVHLAESVERGRAPNLDKLRDPVRHDKDAYRALQEQRRVGAIGPATTGYPFTNMGRVRLDRLETSLDAIRAVKLPGDLVECGTGRGGGAIFLKAYITAHEMPGRTVWVADPFDGSTSAVDRAEASAGEAITGLGADLNTVRDGFARFDLLDDEVRFLQGGLDATLADAPIEAIALLRIGPGLGPAVTTVLDRLYDRITPDGVVVIEGADPAAVEAFRRDRRIAAPLEQVDSVTVTWRRQAADGTGTEQPAVAPRHHGSSLALMVDGAHILTPGVLRFGLAGLTTYAPAIVATQQWYVGPGQQGDNPGGFLRRVRRMEKGDPLRRRHRHAGGDRAASAAPAAGPAPHAVLRGQPDRAGWRQPHVGGRRHRHARPHVREPPRRVRRRDGGGERTGARHRWRSDEADRGRAEGLLLGGCRRGGGEAGRRLQLRGRRPGAGAACLRRLLRHRAALLAPGRGLRRDLQPHRGARGVDRGRMEPPRPRVGAWHRHPVRRADAATGGAVSAPGGRGSGRVGEGAGHHRPLAGVVVARAVQGARARQPHVG